MFIQKNFRYILLTFITVQISSCNSEVKDFKDIFGSRYSEAEQYFERKHWISDTLARYGVDPNRAISIVFPEVIRFSSLKNIMETHSLEVLYTQYGTKYADFSIGKFQMKPSFALQIEKDWNELANDIEFKALFSHFDVEDTQNARLLRIQRLKDEKWQVKYLALFMMIINHKYKSSYIPEKDILFLSAAYNSGYWHDSIYIVQKGKQNYFHTGLLRPERCYNYSEISLSYYKKIAGCRSGNS